MKQLLLIKKIMPQGLNETLNAHRNNLKTFVNSGNLESS
jgi:hypothetical protein